MNLVKIWKLHRYNDRYVRYKQYRRRVITNRPRDYKIFIRFWFRGDSNLNMKTADFEIIREFGANRETASV